MFCVEKDERKPVIIIKCKIALKDTCKKYMIKFLPHKTIFKLLALVEQYLRL